MQKLESRGFILFNRNYRENDKLVKIFTKQAGKRMFFVRGGGSGKLSAVIQPLNIAEFMMTVNDEGLSFIEDYSQAESFKEITSDIFKLSYATYLAALTDAAIADGVVDAQLFAFLEKTLVLMEEGLDYEILTNIFEIQVLDRFGVRLNFHEFVIVLVFLLISRISSQVYFVPIITKKMKGVVIWTLMCLIFWIVSRVFRLKN